MTSGAGLIGSYTLQTCGNQQAENKPDLGVASQEEQKRLDDSEHNQLRTNVQTSRPPQGLRTRIQTRDARPRAAVWRLLQRYRTVVLASCTVPYSAVSIRFRWVQQRVPSREDFCIGVRTLRNSPGRREAGVLQGPVLSSDPRAPARSTGPCVLRAVTASGWKTPEHARESPFPRA
ncbi:hypothetical protein H920_04053 [Fukomys damarensis]|uniref:Uncharacterized protein n=1 Tax=Fukomys damarensis TaxID=885580 RepID=A0A091EGI1_FUKDA|nr:hypothetical protein H920_04053 [Fukomys damarensis]